MAQSVKVTWQCLDPLLHICTAASDSSSSRWKFWNIYCWMLTRVLLYLRITLQKIMTVLSKYSKHFVSSFPTLLWFIYFSSLLRVATMWLWAMLRHDAEYGHPNFAPNFTKHSYAFHKQVWCRQRTSDKCSP